MQPVAGLTEQLTQTRSRIKVIRSPKRACKLIGFRAGGFWDKGLPVEAQAGVLLAVLENEEDDASEAGGVKGCIGIQGFVIKRPCIHVTTSCNKIRDLGGL